MNSDVTISGIIRNKKNEHENVILSAMSMWGSNAALVVVSSGTSCATRNNKSNNKKCISMCDSWFIGRVTGHTRIENNVGIVSLKSSSILHAKNE